MSKTAKGTMLTLVAGVAWGLSGTSGQYLMAHGFPVLVLTNVRLLIAGVLLISYMVLTNRKKLFEMLKDQEAMMSLVLFALLGLLLNQFAYLKSIYESNAGTATVLQYVCPVGILAYTCLKDWVAPTITEVLSMILAIGGTFLIATHGQFNHLSVTPAGLFWGLFAAFTYALYILIPIKLIKRWGSIPVIGVGDDISRTCSDTIQWYPAFSLAIVNGSIPSFGGHYLSGDNPRLYTVSQRNQFSRTCEI